MKWSSAAALALSFLGGFGGFLLRGSANCLLYCMCRMCCSTSDGAEPRLCLSRYAPASCGSWHLTKADTVILMEPWWNPFKENQAIDRANRIGQKNSVSVFRMLATGTNEERMLLLQERKLRIASSLYDSDEALVQATLEQADLDLLLCSKEETYFSSANFKSPIELVSFYLGRPMAANVSTDGI